MGMAEEGGHDCEFVDRPRNIKVECPICLLVLRDPWLTACCGQNFCRRCIERIPSGDGRACPLCQAADEFGAVCNKSLGESLKEHEVYCGHRNEGCEWSGKLVELDTHLNIACLYAIAGCRFNCGSRGKRCSISAHEAECQLRPFTCPYCGDPGVYDDIVNKHWPMCLKYPVPCPNQCGETLQRCSLVIHLDNLCSLGLTDCQFHHAGCTVRLPRRDIPSHMAAELVAHLSLVNQQLLQKLSEQTSDLQVIKKEVDDLRAKTTDASILKKEVDDLRAKTAHDARLISLICRSPTVIKELQLLPIKMPQSHDTNNQCLITQPFYSHLGGYKLQAQLCITKSTLYYSRLEVAIAEGEFDDYLKWPFHGTVVVCVEPDQHHFITFDKDTPIQYKSSQHQEVLVEGYPPMLEVTTKRRPDITIESVSSSKHSIHE